MKVTRRGFAVGVGVVVTGGVVLATPPTRNALCGSPEEHYREASVARLGRACVACDPALTSAAVTSQWRELGAPSGATLEALVAADFDAGRVQHVDGWVLAASEMLAYAASYHRVR